jgi:hypothetical protein
VNKKLNLDDRRIAIIGYFLEHNAVRCAVQFADPMLRRIDPLAYGSGPTAD